MADIERILIKIRELEGYQEELFSILPDNQEDFLQNIEKQRATERILQIMIECVIDICYMLNKELHNGPPPDEEAVFDFLSDKIDNIEIIKKMKGFRNILVHRYGKVNSKLVFQFAKRNVGDFNAFISEVNRLLDNIFSR
ncbi:MAG: DUF86 domain-containing protein [Candidatus Lokiarchaeota archaeon]|nr:DUF86 domain-containing protein [Candidatus Lokiarchaeota archaeon]